MYKIFCSIIVIYLIFLTGCSNSPKYNDEDVAAIVKGEEITIGELRFFILMKKYLICWTGQ